MRRGSRPHGALLLALERRHAGLAAQPQAVGVFGGRRRRRGAAARCGRRRCGRGGGCHEHLAQQVQQPRAGALRVAAVVGEDEADDEALVVVARRGFVGRRRLARREARGRLGRAAAVRHVHPAARLVAQVLELARQPFADLARAALDLAPVAGLDLQPLGEPAFQAAQRRRVGVLDGGPDELVEQGMRVVEADARHVGRRQ